MAMSEIIWMIARDEGGAVLHYNDLISDKINGIVGNKFALSEVSAP